MPGCSFFCCMYSSYRLPMSVVSVTMLSLGSLVFPIRTFHQSRTDFAVGSTKWRERVMPAELCGGLGQVMPLAAASSLRLFEAPRTPARQLRRARSLALFRSDCYSPIGCRPAGRASWNFGIDRESPSSSATVLSPGGLGLDESGTGFQLQIRVKRQTRWASKTGSARWRAVWRPNHFPGVKRDSDDHLQGRTIADLGFCAPSGTRTPNPLINEFGARSLAAPPARLIVVDAGLC